MNLVRPHDVRIIACLSKLLEPRLTLEIEILLSISNHSTSTMILIQRAIPFGGPNCVQLGSYTGSVTFHTLQSTIPFEESITHMFGKEHRTGRLVYTMGKPYAYNGHTSTQETPLYPPIQSIADELSLLFGVTFSTCVANFYPNGTVGLGAHSDDEQQSEHIVTLSFGAHRKFAFTKNDKTETHSFLLPNSSVLVMSGATFQRDWKHAIPKMKCDSPRISLTFRAY
jgi:alkylated DNA repair dioxygenase AlkB